MANPAVYLKDTKPAIIHIDGRLIRAGKGIADLLEKPSVSILARYGLRQNSMEIDQPTASTSQQRPLSEYLMGQALDEALEAGEGVEVFWPWEGGEGRRKVDWRGREAILNYILTHHLSVHLPTSSTTLLLLPPPSLLPPSHLARYTQLAFESLNTPAFCLLDTPTAALFGVATVTPTGLVVHIGRRTTEIVAVLEAGTKWDTLTLVEVGEEDCEEFFTALLLEDREARMGLERLAKEVWGEEGWEGRVGEVARKVAESVIKEGSLVVPGMGGAVHQLEEEGEAKEDDGVFNVAQMLIQSDAAKQVAQLKSKKSNKDASASSLKAAQALADARMEAAAAVAADIKTYSVALPYIEGVSKKGKREINLGIIRNRALEPLYEGKDGGASVQEGMGRCVARVERGWRQAVLEGVVFVGEVARVGSLPIAMISHLTPFLITSPSDEAGELERNANERQADHVRMLKIPGYFPNFHGAQTDLSPFLGASLAAKLIFSDGKTRQCITKSDYIQHGPAAGYMAGVLD